jgi:hypothetical protein
LSRVLEGLFQAGAHGRDLGVFFRRQVVQILVSGIAGVDLVLDAVKASHHQCGEAQVGVGTGIGEAGFDTACLVAGLTKGMRIEAERFLAE